MSTLTITTIQADLSWEDKATNLRRFEEKILGIREQTEIVILPEMFSTGFSMNPAAWAEPMDGPTIAWMKKIAAHKRVILTGSIIIEEEGNYYNRLIWMLPNGQYGHYDKRHRFAYAGENEYYTAGSRRVIASVKGWKINLQVCYDLRFPIWSRQTPKEPLPALHAEGAGHRTVDAPPDLEYDVIIYVANWPEVRSHAWTTLLLARAIENQSYVVGVNRVGTDGKGIVHSGDSLIVSPLGEALYHAPPEEAIFTYTLQKEQLEKVRTKMPFWRDADHFSIEI